MSPRVLAPLVFAAFSALLPGCSSSSSGDSSRADAGSTETDAGSCPTKQPADDCGECGGDGSSCRHPLAGSYAARTQFYARQRTTAQGMALDLISKGVVLSLVNIDKRGVAEEHYCFLEITSPEGVISWTAPSTLQSVPDTSLQLAEQDSQFVRPLALHQGYFSWSPEAPEDCVAGERHASGCRCPADDGLPTRGDDCRVQDIDGDGRQGGKMYLTIGDLESVDSTEALVTLNVVARLNLGWRLPSDGSTPLTGTIQGGLEQVELSRSGDFASSLGELENTMCRDGEGNTRGHVELVSGDFSCESLLAGRSADRLGYGVFASDLDGEPPALEDCPVAGCPGQPGCPAP